MGDFAGVFRRDGAPTDRRTAERLKAALPGVSRARAWEAGPVVFVHRPLRERDVATTTFFPAELSGGRAVAADGILDEPVEVAVALGAAAPLRAGDAALLAAACETWGGDAARRLDGSFAFALWDGNARTLTLARDRLGARSLFYVELPGHILFATSIPLLLALPETPRGLDDLTIARTLTIDPAEQEQTIYRQIRRVPPGGMAIFDRRSSRVARYWTVDDIRDIRLARDDDYVEAARALFDRAVACRLEKGGRFATTLSGGLDSSGIAATIARLSGETRFDAFHRAPGADHPYAAIDERALVTEFVARYPTIDLRIHAGTDQAAADVEPEIDAALLGFPRSRSPNTTWFDPMMDVAARTDIETMFTGGNGNITLSWGGYPNLVADIKRGRIGGAWRTAQGVAAEQRRSTPRFLAAHFLRPLAPRRWLRKRHDRAVEGHAWAAHSLISKDFLASANYEAAARQSGHDIPFEKLPNYRERRLRLLQGQRPADRSAAARHFLPFDFADPYADRRLVEFTLGIPETQFWHRGEDRWLARRVLADRLPPAMLRERRRGSQCPEWFGLMSARRDELIETVERLGRSPLAARVLDIPRMRQMLDDWPKDATEAMPKKLLLGTALSRAISVGGFLRWHEGANE